MWHVWFAATSLSVVMAQSALACKYQVYSMDVCLRGLPTTQLPDYEEALRRTRADFVEGLSHPFYEGVTYTWTSDPRCLHHPANRSQGYCWIRAKVENLCHNLPLPACALVDYPDTKMREDWGAYGDWARGSCNRQEGGNATYYDCQNC